MDRLQRGHGGTLTVTLYDANGVAADPGAGDGTADVTDSAGVAVSGSPFAAVHGGANSGQYTITLPSTLSVLDTYDVMWHFPGGSFRPTQFELVGAFLFAIPELWTFDTQLNNPSLYTPALVRAIRAGVEECFEHEKVGRVAFRPRGSRDHLDGTGTNAIMVDHTRPTRVVSSKIGTTALTGPELADLKVYPFGKIVRDTMGSWTRGNLNVELFYEHGLASVPAPIHIAALRYARHLIVKSAFEINDRATAVLTDAGGYRLTIAGRDGWTGLPEVDSVLKSWTKATPGFA
jgi:hypothetical protein